MIRAGLKVVLVLAIVALGSVASTGEEFDFACGRFAIVHSTNGKCLTVDGDHLHDAGATIYLDEYKGLDSQLWLIQSSSLGGYVIYNQASWMAMIVDYATEAQSGANIKQYHYQGHARQRWNLQILHESPIGPTIAITRVENDRSEFGIVPEVHPSGWTNAVQIEVPWIQPTTTSNTTHSDPRFLWYFFFVPAP